MKEIPSGHWGLGKAAAIPNHENRYAWLLHQREGGIPEADPDRDGDGAAAQPSASETLPNEPFAACQPHK